MADGIFGTVAGADVSEALFDVHVLPVRACGHVAVDQRVREVGAGGLELPGQLGGEATFGCFDHGARVVSHQSAEHVTGLRGVAEVPGAVERVKAGVDEVGCVPDVVQQGGGGEQVGVGAQDGGETAGLGGNAQSVCPTSGQRCLQDRAGGLFRPVS
jgi:hypothetical protein